ncbi:MAG TPA: hypothetical protein VGJ15_05230 [Pirellulales bacterium]|jgi:hypothetical protein
MDQPPAINRRRWFKFSLRTLLLVVLACAIGTWFYLTAWPWIRAQLEQSKFEQAARQLKVGDSTYSALQSLPKNKTFSATYTANNDHQMTGTMHYVLANGVYFVHFTYPAGYSGGMLEAKSVRVEVFRLPPLSKNYKPQRKLSDDEQLNHTEAPKPGESGDTAYANDFLQYATGDRKDDFSLHCELMYADPPAPASKSAKP